MKMSEASEKDEKKGEIEEFKKIEGYNPYGNQAKILWHMDRLCSFLKKGSTFPIQVELNPTNHCNMSCKWCLTEYAHKKEYLDITVLNRFLKEFKELGGKSIDWTGGGEPAIYPYIKEAIEKASEVGLKQGMMTNGLFKKDLIETLGENMEWVRFSLDTVDPESYGEMKGVGPNALKQVLENIRNLSEYSPRPRVVVNVNLAKWNAQHVMKTVGTTKDLGADGFQIRPILPPPHEAVSSLDRQFYLDWWGELERIKSFEGDGFQVFISHDKFKDIIEGKLDERSYDKCQYHQFIVVLNANGDLCVCTHHLGDDRFTFGNIYEKSVKEIWGSDKREEVIKFCNEKRDFKECQVCCKGHELNKFLHFVQNPDKKSDPDFF